MSSGIGYICALKTDGSRWCAGRNDRGQLGDGLRWKLSPVRVLGYPEPIAP